MKLKPWLLALSTLAAASAHATDYSLTLYPTNGNAPSSSQFYYHKTPGSFSDKIALVPSAAVLSAGVTLTALDLSVVDPSLPQTSFTSVVLESSSNSGSTWSQVGTGSTFSGLSFAGGAMYRLLVNGLAGTTGGVYSVAYTALAPVPEPASVALFLAGIGALGLVSRRRKMAEKDHADVALA